MKVLFVKAGDRDWINYPAQYAVLSSYIKQEGHSVDFYDASLVMHNPEQTFKSIKTEGVDVIGISVYTASQNWVKDFVELVKKNNPEIKVIIGGPHISSLETFAVEHIGADIGIVGEGELPFAALLKRLEDGRSFDDVPGLIWKEGETWKNTLNVPRLRVKDLDTLPMPDYEMIPPTNYFDVFRGASVARKREKCAFMFTSRGCPYMCTYCATNCTWEGKINGFSANRIVQEIELLKNNYGIDEFWFGDDTFTFSRRRTVDFCNEIIEKKLKIFWRLPNGIRLESVDEELTALMSKAGCYMTGVGVETGSESAMELMKKKLDLKIVPEKLRILKKNKILVSGFFIFGMPWETPEQVDETIKFILKYPFDRMQISIFTPYPGSEEFDTIMSKDKPEVYAENVRRYLYEGKLDPFLKNLDLDTLYKKLRNTVLRFYLQPRVLWSILKGLTRQQIRDIWRHPMIQGLFKKKRSDEDTYIDLNN